MLAVYHRYTAYRGYDDPYLQEKTSISTIKIHNRGHCLDTFSPCMDRPCLLSFHKVAITLGAHAPAFNAMLISFFLDPDRTQPLLIPSRTRRLLVFPQTSQQLPKLLLSRPIRPAFGTLSTEIHQLSNPFPACAPSRSILPICQELSGVFTSLGNSLVFLRVVVFVEVVNSGLSSFYSFLLFPSGDFGAVLEIKVAPFTPLSKGVGKRQK